MATILITTAQTEKDLQGIINLQQANIAPHLTPEEITSQGFLTVVHSMEDLKRMNAIEPHIIAKDDDRVVAYTLSMTVKSKNDLPILFPMFEKFEKIIYLDKPVSEFNYIIVGQACVDKDHRGQGILDQCYAMFKSTFKNRYDFAITEISCRNARSLKAHQRIGFSEVFIYMDPRGEEWSVVIWEWQ